MADRHGYHRPARIAALGAMAGAGCALVACWLPGGWAFGLHCVGAALAGVGTNVGLIAIQRTAGQLAGSSTERVRVFSWLGMAPSLANVVGPVAAGFMIDAGGFAAAYALLMAMPIVSLVVARRVPAQASAVTATRRPAGRSRWDLLATPGLKRLLFVNWLMSASWDVHSFAVPVLGHARGYNASTIGLVLGVFTAAVTVVRFIIPLLAHRLREVTVLRAAMLLHRRGVRALPVRRHALADGAVRDAAGADAGIDPADDHEHAAPPDAGRPAWRGDRVPLDGDQLLQQRDAAGLRRWWAPRWVPVRCSG